MFEDDATKEEKITCIVRNFILDQANQHNNYDPVRQAVALPCIIYAWRDATQSGIHLECLTNYALENHEKKALEFEDKVIKSIKK